jgi:hypothetical protein
MPEILLFRSVIKKKNKKTGDDIRTVRTVLSSECQKNLTSAHHWLQGQYQSAKYSVGSNINNLLSSWENSFFHSMASERPLARTQSHLLEMAWKYHLVS